MIKNNNTVQPVNLATNGTLPTIDQIKITEAEVVLLEAQLELL